MSAAPDSNASALAITSGTGGRTGLYLAGDNSNDISEVLTSEVRIEPTSKADSLYYTDSQQFAADLQDEDAPHLSRRSHGMHDVVADDSGASIDLFFAQI
jgi:hypothetical protein